MTISRGLLVDEANGELTGAAMMGRGTDASLAEQRRLTVEVCDDGSASAICAQWPQDGDERFALGLELAAGAGRRVIASPVDAISRGRRDLAPMTRSP